MFSKTFNLILAIAAVAAVFVVMSEAQFVEDGLFAYYNFDEVEGKTVKDVLGKHDGTIEGELKVVEGKVGKALEYDGSGAYVLLSNPDDFICNADFTWCAWIKTEAAGGVIMANTSTEEGSDVRGAKTFFLEGGRLNFDTGWVGAVEGNIPVNDGKWHYVAVTVKFNGDDTIQLYVDGEPDAQGQLNVNEFPETGFPILIGADPRCPGEPLSVPFSGVIDEVAIYNRVLSEEEIKRNFNSVSLKAAAQPGDKLASVWGEIKTR